MNHVPVEASVEGRRRQLAVGCDMMLLPEYRGWGWMHSSTRRSLPRTRLRHETRARERRLVPHHGEVRRGRDDGSITNWVRYRTRGRRLPAVAGGALTVAERSYGSLVGWPRARQSSDWRVRAVPDFGGPRCGTLGDRCPEISPTAARSGSPSSSHTTTRRRGLWHSKRTSFSSAIAAVASRACSTIHARRRGGLSTARASVPLIGPASRAARSRPPSGDRRDLDNWFLTLGDADI